MPRYVVPAILLLLLVGFIPAAFVLYARNKTSKEPRVHLVHDMDHQPKYKPQTVNPVFADGREQDFTANNKKSIIETPMGETELKAKWKGGGLIVKTKAGERTTTETYQVTEDRRILTVLVEMGGQGPMGTVSFKRIYRPAESEGEAPEPAE